MGAPAGAALRILMASIAELMGRPQNPRDSPRMSVPSQLIFISIPG